MIYVYLMYGLAFFAGGLVLALQRRVFTPVLPSRALVLLALFCVVHGAAEWLALAGRVEELSAAPRHLELLRLLTLATTALSFVLLAHFGVELAVVSRRWPAVARVAPGALLVAAAALIVSGSQRWGAEWRPAAEAIVRYVICLPAALLTAGSLLLEARSAADGDHGRRRGFVVWVAAAFVGYAVFAGVLGPRAPFFPASIVNAQAFQALTHVPVEVPRAMLAATIAILLTEAFVVEAAREHAETERLREEFISVVAHDLRNPLSVIVGASKLLERRVGAEDQGLLARLRSSAHTLDRMISDLLDASRIEASRLALRRQRVELRRLVREIVERSSVALGGRQVRIDAPGGPLEVDADPMRLEQVLVNLLTNAVKYSHEGTDIVVTVGGKDSEAIVAVTDRGRGIPAEDLPLVFTRFYRTSGATQGNRPGIGLGLYIARGLIQAHGGRLWAQSQLDGETTFRFALPLATAAATAEVAAPQRARTSTG